MMNVALLILRGTFNTRIFISMVCRTLEAIKVSTNMQVDTFILLFLCYPFDVDAMRGIPMVVDK